MSYDVLVYDVPFKHGVFPHSLFILHQMQFLTSLLSEELLGVHETIQIYYKFKLVVPLRLLHVNNLNHRLVRNVSQFKLLLCSHPQYRSFTKKGWPVSSLETLLSQTPAPGSWPACYHQGYCSCKNLHPEFLTLFCLHITSW